MQTIDFYSYACGFIDCCNEVVSAGVKALAFSQPLESAGRDALIPYARGSCQSHGTKLYIEDSPLITDLFPVSLCRGKFLLLFYREDHILEQYLRLKERKESLRAEGAYFGGNRNQIAWELGRLLSYPQEGIRRCMEENGEREQI